MSTFTRLGGALVIAAITLQRLVREDEITCEATPTGAIKDDAMDGWVVTLTRHSRFDKRSEPAKLITEYWTGFEHRAPVQRFMVVGGQGMGDHELPRFWDHRGLGLRKNWPAFKRVPDAAEVLDALLSDARSFLGVDSVEEFGQDHGYYPYPSLAAANRTQELYIACAEVLRKLYLFLGPDLHTYLEAEVE